MSGRMRRVKLSTGEQYDVPEENAEAFMGELDGAGLAFSSDGYAPDGDTSDPPPPTAPGPSEAPPGPPEGAGEGFPEDDRSVWERFVDTVRQAPLPGKMAADPNTQALAGGFAHGITAGTPRALPGALGEGMRAIDDGARAGNPRLYAAADIGGSVAMPVHLPGGGGVARNIATQAAEGGAQGAVRAYSDADPEQDMGDRALEALATGGKDALTAGVITGGMSGVDAVAGGLAKGMGAASRGLRTAAIGGTPGQFRKLADQRGLDFVESELGALPEQLGVTNTIKPQNASDYARRLAETKATEGGRVDQALADANDQLSPGFVDKDDLLARMGEAEAAAQRGATGNRGARASAIGNVRDAMADQTIKTPADLAALKRTYEANAYPDALSGSAENAMGQAHKLGADVSRDQLRNAMDHTLPETQDAFNSGNQRFGQAAILEEMARNRAAGNAAQTGPMMTGMLGAVGGGLGAMVGQGNLGMAALGAAAAKPMFNMARDYGPDLGANVARLGERGMGAAAGGADWLSRNAPTGNLTAALGGQRPDAPDGDQALEQMGADLAKQQGEARGYLLPQAVKQAVQSGQLGPYTDMFAELDDDADIAAQLQKLKASDETFRRQFMPLLNQMTAER